MLQLIHTDRTGILAFDAIGKITDQDYKEAMVPMLEQYLKTSDQAHMLIRFGPDFEGYTMHAAADDALLGMRHLHDFERIAIVTDHEWLGQSIRLFGPLMSAKLKVFDLEAMDEALTWVAW